MKLLLSILLCFVFFGGVSQEINSYWSGALEKIESETPKEIFPNPDSGYTIVKRIKGEKAMVSIDILDSNNTLITSNKVQVQGDKIIHVGRINNKITLFSVFHNVEKKTDELNAATLNSKGELSGTILIESLKSNGGYLAVYKVAVSEDGNKVGVICEKAYMKEKFEELGIKILDKDLTPILTKNYNYTFTCTKRRFNVPMINNNGSLYIVKRIRVKASNKYFLTLIKESGVEEDHDIKLRSMRIADIGGAFNEDGELILSGFYSGYGSLNFEGAFTFKYNESIQPIYRKEFMLPENLITSLMDKKELSKFGNGLHNFHVKDIVVSTTNNNYLIAEHISVIKNEKEYVESRKGLAIIKFSDKGDFLWSTPVLTDQNDEVDHGYWSSSIIIENNENLLVFYNQVGENVKKPEEVYGKNTLVGMKLSTINLNGVAIDKPLVGIFNELPEAVILNAKASYFSKGNLVVVAENKLKTKNYLGILSLPKKK